MIIKLSDAMTGDKVADIDLSLPNLLFEMDLKTIPEEVTYYQAVIIMMKLSTPDENGVRTIESSEIQADYM